MYKKVNKFSEGSAIEKGTAQRLSGQYVDPQSYKIDIKLKSNTSHLQEIFADSNDVHIREFLITPLNIRAALVFVESMADQVIINEHILEKLTLPPVSGSANSERECNVLRYLQDTLLTVASVTEVAKFDDIVKRVLSGDTALFIDGITAVIVVATRKVESRAISEPESEIDVRGPRDGFTEELRVNITLLRRRLINPNLVVKMIIIGVRSNTAVAVVYFRGIVDPELVNEVEKRLHGLEIDTTTIGIQGLLEDHPYSPFPTILATERPDKFVAALADGKVGIVIDGTPFCLVVPTTLSDFFQAGDDYSEKWLSAAIIRFTRYVAAFMTLTLPALYIAIVSFHPAFLPTPLTLTLAAVREGIPFPAFVESLLMISMLEIMQEANIRIPKAIGPAVSIVGGLVLGDAAVRAGLVSPAMVIVTSITAISSFNIVNYRINLPLRLLRVPLMAIATVFGLYGVMIGLLAIITHLSILESFGEPYLAPFVPKNSANLKDLKDTVFVAPPASMKQRPAYLEPQDKRRQK